MVGGLFDDNDDVDGRETVTKLADSQCKQVQRVTTKLQDKIPPTTLYRWSKRVVRWLEAVHQFCDNDLQVIPAKWLLWKRLKSGKGQLSDRQTQKVWRWMRNRAHRDWPLRPKIENRNSHTWIFIGNWILMWVCFLHFFDLSTSSAAKMRFYFLPFLQGKRAQNRPENPQKWNLAKIGLKSDNFMK